MKQHIVRKNIAINATPAAVWDALTNPENTTKYFFNCAVYSDWKVGSPIMFKGRIFLVKKIEMHGRINQVEQEKLLQYTLKNDSDPGTTSTVTDELSYANGITTLSITDDVGMGEGAEKRYKRSVKGWDKVLKGLKELVEEEQRA